MILITAVLPPHEEHIAYSLESSFGVERNDGVILSIRMDMTTCSGGANVGPDCVSVNVINSNPAQLGF